MRNYFTFNGVDSRDYGVYISGQGTFSAPQKAYTFYNIPGRNGALIGSDKRLENLEVSYEAFIYKDFDENLARFRSFLLSQDGYQRLSDSYHPDEYRMAAYVGPFEPVVQRKNDAGSFVITFNCKPQRFLISGDTRYSWLNQSINQDLNGRILMAYMPLIDRTKMTMTIERPYPTNATPLNQQQIGDRLRSLQIYADNVRIARILDVQNSNQATVSLESQTMYEGTVDWIAGTLTRTTRVVTVVNNSPQDPAQPYLYDFMPVTGTPHLFKSTYSTTVSQILACNSYPLISDNHFHIYVENGAFYIYDERFYNQLELYRWMAANPVRIVYSDEASYQFTPISLPTKAGWVDLRSRVYTRGFVTTDPAILDTTLGSLAMRYAGMGDNILNPTIFQSQPILRVYGSGSFDLNDITITIDTPGTYTDIDCEMMDCYEGSINRNNNVSFSTYDFPVLYPGTNAVTIQSGSITAVEVVPRWWRV